MSTIKLLRPTTALLPSYVSALEAGWSPDNVRKEIAAREQLDAIDIDAERFVDGLDDPAASGGQFLYLMARLSRGFRALSVGYGTVISAVQSDFVGRSEPPNCHHTYSDISAFGCAVEEGNGYAKQALNLMLGEAKGKVSPMSN